MRLIDGDALKKKMIADADTYILSDGIRHGYHNCEQLVEDAPTIEERKTGKWIRETKHYKDSEQEFYYCEKRCSECGTKRKIGWAGVRYCPMCGTMMQEGEQP